MSDLYLAALNSGSNANCYYVGNDREAVLIDAGLSCRETARRMKQLGLEMDRVKALFISHEHNDHIKGLPGLVRKYGWPVYITPPTLRQAGLRIPPERTVAFEHGTPVPVGDLRITPFRKYHDAADPHSFIVSGHGLHVGVMTDIGHACPEVRMQFGKCHAAFLESNYCDTLLANGPYPFPLQERIRSDRGHLSNDQALDLFRQHRSAELRLLILSHLSQHNNHPLVVEELFTPHAGTVRIAVASRYHPSDVFVVRGGPGATTGAKPMQQLTLFG